MNAGKQEANEGANGATRDTLRESRAPRELETRVRRERCGAGAVEKNEKYLGVGPR